MILQYMVTHNESLTFYQVQCCIREPAHTEGGALQYHHHQQVREGTRDVVLDFEDI